MDRRSSLKLLLLAAATPRHLWGAAPAASFESAWRDWPSMRWVGPEYWGNRLQDWALEDGTASCRLLAPNRTLHCLTHRVTSEEGFTTSVSVDPSCLKGQGTDAIVGFRLGINGTTDDVRNAAVHGKGIDVGINAMGGLVIGGTPLGDVILPLDDQYRLECSVVPSGSNALVTITAKGRFSTSLGASLPAHRLLGNVALLSHAPKATGTPGATFADWRIEGPGLTENADATFGPIMFAQYTVHRGTLKLTAQLAPIDTIPGVRAALDVRQPSGEWATVATAPIDPLARTTRFRVEGWDTSVAKPYRIRLDIPLAGGVRSFRYDGTIAAEPSNRPVKAAIFSCNADFGFPDDEVVRHVQAHDADLAVFLGDQYYESSGGFGIEHDTIEGATLDMLHKWYMFGWSYRDIFRHIPSGCIPDDHDVYHGNVWGEGGHAAPLDKGWGAPAQDRGGYKMWPEWINAMQMAQTSNLPDPYDPTPVDQGIGVYYTRWDYGGVSFAILEDRKFKSAPANVLPAEAKVYNGWLQNPDFDIRQHRDIDATLLGERQMRFLADWAADWSRSYLKVVFSQTNWAAVHTIPASAMSGDVISLAAAAGAGRGGDRRQVLGRHGHQRLAGEAAR